MLPCLQNHPPLLSRTRIHNPPPSPQCNAAGDRCVACTGARSLVDGVCSLQCKLL